MELQIIKSDGQISNDGSVVNASGGTELMREELMNRLSDNEKNEFNIICSRVRDIDPNKKNILWNHDLWNDPETLHLRDEEKRKRFAKLVFVSNYQWQSFHMGHEIPWSESVVLRNAIIPIEPYEKSTDQVRLIYHTTPHRGLELLYPAFESLYNLHGDKIVLDVYSSFSIYGWPQRDVQYENLFEACRNHPGINYHGAVSNEEVREALKSAHIFAYPSIWPETSCIAAIEAMSAECAIVCPNFGALPETTGNFAAMYSWNEDANVHANQFAHILNIIIENYWHEGHQSKLKFAKSWADNFYNWNSRAEEWKALLTSLR